MPPVPELVKLGDADIPVLMAECCFSNSMRHDVVFFARDNQQRSPSWIIGINERLMNEFFFQTIKLLAFVREKLVDLCRSKASDSAPITDI